MTIAPRLAATALPLAFLLSACSGEAGGAAAPVVRDSAGVTIVESSAPALGADAWTLSAEPIFQVGDVDGADAYWFGALMGMTRLSDGTVVAADMQRSRLAFYTPDGVFIRAVGREGEGPGEFRQISRLHRLPGDSLLAEEFSSRASLFDPAGQFVRAVTLGPAGSSRTPLRRYPLLGPLEGGSFAAGGSFSIGRDGPPDSASLYRMNIEGAVEDTILRYSTGRWKLGGLGPTREFFAPTFLMAAAGHLYTGYTDRFRVDVRDREGRLVRIVSRSWDPVPVTQAEIETYRERFLGSSGEGGRPMPEQMRPQLLRVLEESGFAEIHPAFLRLMVDGTENLWIQERTLAYQLPAEGGFQPTVEEPSHWSVFDPGGSWITNVTMPANFRVFEIGQDYVLGLGRDPTGVEQVRMYNLIKGG